MRQDKGGERRGASIPATGGEWHRGGEREVVVGEETLTVILIAQYGTYIYALSSANSNLFSIAILSYLIIMTITVPLTHVS